MASTGAANAARHDGATEERKAILALVQEAAWRCRQLAPKQEDEGVARLRVLAELRKEIEGRGTPATGA